MRQGNEGHYARGLPDRQDEDTRLLETIADAKRGQEKAFAELVRQYRRQVASVAYRIVGDYDDAADITQLVFLKTAQNIKQYDESRRFYTWLYRITVNASIDYLRRHRRHRHEPLDIAIAQRDQDAENPENRFYIGRLHEHIHAATERLNGKQKMAFTLRDLEGCQIGTVAGIMDMPEATVRWYLHRARAGIRRELKRRCPHLLHVMGIV